MSPARRALGDLTLGASITLPGQVVASDAHDIDGATHRWAWTTGRPAEPGIAVTWRPAAVDDAGSSPPVFVRVAAATLIALTASAGFAVVRRRADRGPNR